MINTPSRSNKLEYFGLKLVKKKWLTNNSFSLSFEIPEQLRPYFKYQSGQYSSIKYEEDCKDFSYASAPDDEHLSFGIKVGDKDSFSHKISQALEVGDVVQISTPQGRFTLPNKPNEKRTVLCFASGIGITPIISHLKDILYNEPLSRCFLFYGNRNKKNISFFEEISELEDKYAGRFFVFYFFSQEKTDNPMLSGRLNEKKVSLIINQILGIDEEDDESTIWDSTDAVLICGPGGMIKSIANACHENGIRKKDIHYELFGEFNEDIYELEKPLPLVKDITIKFRLLEKDYLYKMKDNKSKILDELLTAGFNIPYSCKSGICGSCRCQKEKGKVFMTEDEYLTDSEVDAGWILPCISYPLDDNIQLNFDKG